MTLRWPRTIAQIWSQRADRYSELRSEAASMRLEVEMSYIGRG